MPAMGPSACWASRSSCLTRRAESDEPRPAWANIRTKSWANWDTPPRNATPCDKVEQSDNAILVTCFCIDLVEFIPSGMNDCAIRWVGVAAWSRSRAGMLLRMEKLAPNRRSCYRPQHRSGYGARRLRACAKKTLCLVLPWSRMHEIVDRTGRPGSCHRFIVSQCHSKMGGRHGSICQSESVLRLLLYHSAGGIARVVTWTEECQTAGCKGLPG
jgi:hypothetical protein